MTTSKPDIILYGGPGSGKTTQAELLSQKLTANHLNMGGLLRQFVTTKHPDVAIAKKVMLAGRLIPVRITNSLVEKFVNQLRSTDRLVIEGYPRDMAQVRFLDKLLVKSGRTAKLIYVKLPISVARERLIKRAKIEHRPDDLDPKALTARIKVFQHEAKDLLAHYRASKRLITIDGDQTLKQVHTAIMKAVKSC